MWLLILLKLEFNKFIINDMIISMLSRLFFLTFLIVFMIKVSDVPADDFDLFEPFNAGQSQEVGIYDPFEGVNRRIFRFNQSVNDQFLEPLLETYRGIFSVGVRQRISHFFVNLQFPISFINNGLQFKFQNMKTETYRFVINSTMGILGFFDVAATRYNLQSRFESFGQTLGYWGFHHGPYLVIPILGPSTLRHGIGLIGDYQLNPALTFTNDINMVHQLGGGLGAQLLMSGVNFMDTLNLYEDYYIRFIRNAIDPYTATKVGYVQFQNQLVLE